MPDTIPSALGNPGPRYRAVLTLPPGPKRLTDDREMARFHVAPGGRATRWNPPLHLAAARNILVVRLDFVGDWIVTTPFQNASCTDRSGGVSQPKPLPSRIA